jgi:integrating conjugative element protein (TIGR03749 family)
LILIDVSALPPTRGAAPLEPVRILDAIRSARDGRDHETVGAPVENAAVPEDAEKTAPTPLAVVLTRYAAQSLYSPLRTIEPVPGITPVSLRDSLDLESLLPGLAIRATALLAWRLEDTWVTAVRLTHTTGDWLALDPRALQGDFIAATFQHQTLGPAGDCTDTTVAYLVTRGHGLAESLLPALSPVDASPNRQNSGQVADGARGATP